MGDVHGHRGVLVTLLRESGLVDARERWSGADASLWLVGDLFDRGPDGLGALELVRRLERDAGGAVRCLLGNHEAMIVAARRFGRKETSFDGYSFHDVWKLNGGLDTDLAGLTDDHVEWITRLPPLAVEGEWLLLHADTHAYLELGSSVDEVETTCRAILRDGDVDEVDELLGVLCDRQRLGDRQVVDRLLAVYGGSRIMHGHTPIASVLRIEPQDVKEALVYGDGRVTNVDHCLFAGGPGFVVRLDGGGPGTEA